VKRKARKCDFHRMSSLEEEVANGRQLTMRQLGVGIDVSGNRKPSTAVSNCELVL
jgi:hypothetical protein